MKIWTVEGTTGSYEDIMDWYVIAYTKKAIAEKHAKLATKRAKEIQENIEKDKDSDGFVSFWGVMENPENRNQYDPHMQMDYTGTSYRVYGLELSDIKTVKEFEEHIFVEAI